MFNTDVVLRRASDVSVPLTLCIAFVAAAMAAFAFASPAMCATPTATVSLAVASPDTAPVFVDPYEPNGTTATANPISADGSEFTGYCDPEGADYLSFPATKGKMYRLVVTTTGLGGWGHIGVYAADGTQIAPGGAAWNMPGSVRATQTVEVWAVSDSDQTLYVGYTDMWATPLNTSSNIPSGSVAYHVTVTECERPVLKGTVTDPKTGDPVAGARVTIWTNPVWWVDQSYFPAFFDLNESTLTATDGTYQFALSAPCRVGVYFDDPAGARSGEFYEHTAVHQRIVSNGPPRLVSCPADSVVTGIDGHLRQFGHLVVNARCIDTGLPVPGAGIGLGCEAPDLSLADYWALADTGPDGEAHYNELDPRKSYEVFVRSQPDTRPGSSYSSGYRYVGLGTDRTFGVSDGTTHTIDVLFRLEPSVVGLSVPSTSVLARSPFILSGTVTWLGSGLGSQPIDVDVSANGTDWSALGTTHTDADGSYSFETSATKTCYYRARFAGSSDRGAGTSGSALVTIAEVGSLKQPVYRFYNKKNGSHFYTVSEVEKASVLKNLSKTYSLDGVAYHVSSAYTTPLYRFYNKKNGSHFYTDSEAEMKSVLKNLSKTYSLDGVAYNVSAILATGSVPVYRFYNKRNGSHFYTAGESEKVSVVKNLSKTYSLDGVAFYVAP